MNLRKFKPIIFCLSASGMLVFGLLWVLGGAPQIARAAPGDLFVTTAGHGTECTQVAPCDLSTALAQSSHGDTIYMAQGTYTGTGDAVFSVAKSVKIFGGWDALTSTLPVRDPDIYTTTLDGENARRVVYISGDITPTLDGFVITRGNSSNAAIDPGYGGGIYSGDADPIITNNVIGDNIAYTDPNSWAQGGGIFIRHSDGLPTPSIIRGNLITNNTASSSYRGKGGGLLVAFCDGILIRENTFLDNLAGATNNGMGGGLALNNSSAIVSGNLIDGNMATPSGDGFGGGIYSQVGVVNLNGNSIYGSKAEYGAVTFEYSANVTVTNNIIAQNPAGGVFVRGSASVPMAGTLAHNTFAENGKEAVFVGYFNSGNSTLNLTNNIIISHTTGIHVYPGAIQNLVTATHTLFYDNSWNTAGSIITSTNEITGSNPLFMEDPEWRYRLQLDSPAIDTGTSVPWLMTDIDGDPRPLPTGGSYDIGADEANWTLIYLPMIGN